MNPSDNIAQGRPAAIALAIASWLIFASAYAGEIQTLAWDATQPDAIQVKAKDGAAYKTERLEGGLRLRVTFTDSTQGKGLEELPGRDKVKGVYPYLAEDGTSVNVDVLMAEPAELKVEKTDFGFRLIPTAATTQAASSTAPAPVTAPAATAVAPVAAPAPAAAAGNAIQDIRFTTLPGERVQVNLKLDRAPDQPGSFTITNPPRLAFDFANTGVGAVKRALDVNAGAVSSINLIEAEGRTRVVFSLVRPVSHATSIAGNEFVVTFDTPVTAVAGAVEPKTTHFASGAKEGKYSLQSVDFRRGAQGNGKIVIKLSDPAVGVDIREQAGEILLDFLNSSVPAALQRRLDVVDFATPVQTIDTYQQGKNVRMVITPRGKYEHIAFQAGDVFTISINPVIEKEGDKKVDEFGYRGEKLSLNFQNIEVRAALQVLADFTGLNFVVSDTVKGSLTLRLKDVPWDQALDIISETKNLAVRKRGNVITVAPAAEVAAREKAAFEAQKANIELEPLRSELIQINYAKAEEIANFLKSIQAIPSGTPQIGAPRIDLYGNPVAAQASGSTSSNTLLSPRGQVTVDKRTNSLLIQDVPTKIAEVRKLIGQLDRPIRQVMIEARLVEAVDSYSQSIGVRFGHLTDKQNGNTRTITTGRLDTLDPLINDNEFEYIPSGLNVNLPASNLGAAEAAGAFTVSIFKGGNILNLELSALEAEGKGKIISSPRVITGDQQKAFIKQGQERVFSEPGGSSGGSTSFLVKEASLKLEVTPQITPDDRVNLNVLVTKDNFSSTQFSTLNLKQINTQVLLDNGETVAIGGIFEQDKNKDTTKVPFFGDLPLLGWLFRNTTERDVKTELLIFLTPRILAENLSIR